MFALVVRVRIEAGAEENAIEGVRTNLVPRVRQAPGARAGYWLVGDAEGEGMSMVVFDSREQADAAAQTVPENPAPGVTRVSVSVREVVAGF